MAASFSFSSDSVSLAFFVPPVAERSPRTAVGLMGVFRSAAGPVGMVGSASVVASAEGSALGVGSVVVVGGGAEGGVGAGAEICGAA
jgi:hypothetical protein